MITPYMRNANTDALEYHEVTASEAVAYGEALVMSSGKLTKCGATTKPAYLAAGSCAAGSANVIPVLRVSDEVIYETALSEASASIAKGAKYTLSSDGLKITATTTSGVAEVVSWDGKAQGDKVRVRF